MVFDPVHALATPDLTNGEREGLKNIDLYDFQRTVTGLDEYVSKGAIDLGSIGFGLK
jgi:hypothetical protein